MRTSTIITTNKTKKLILVETKITRKVTMRATVILAKWVGEKVGKLQKKGILRKKD